MFLRPGDFAALPWGPLAVSADMFVQLGMVVLLTTSGWKPGKLPDILQYIGQPHNRVTTSVVWGLRNPSLAGRWITGPPVALTLI